MATFIKRSSGWLAQVRLKGHDSQCKTHPTKAHAIKWAGEIEAELRASSGRGSVNKTVAQAMDRYQLEVTPHKKGARWESIRIDKLRRELPFVGKPMNKVTVTDISEWRDRSLKRLAPSSVNREIWGTLSPIFTIAMKEWRWCDHNPMKEVRRPKLSQPRDRLTTDEEKQAMLDVLGYVEGKKPETANQRVAYAYLIALETAMRAGEICGLQKEDLYLQKRYVQLNDTKNGKRRQVPLSTRAVELFNLVPQGVGIKPTVLDTLWRRARGMAGVKGLTFHDSRHQAITNLARRLNVLELARMVGHTNPKMLMTYFNETATEIANRLE